LQVRKGKPEGVDDCQRSKAKVRRQCRTKELYWRLNCAAASTHIWEIAEVIPRKKEGNPHRSQKGNVAKGEGKPWRKKLEDGRERGGDREKGK